MKHSLSLIIVCAFTFFAWHSKNICMLTLEIVDSETGQSLPGLIKILRADGEPIELNGLISRGIGLRPYNPANYWFVLDKRVLVQVPQEKLQVYALSGLETEMFHQKLDLLGKKSAKLRIALHRFYNANKRGYYSGNTHLHLKQINRQLAENYLHKIPKADGLDLVFLSVLEREGETHTYVSNTFTKEDLKQLSKAGTLFANGEEHRHNFTDFGEGFGHVMLLNIKTLIQPISFGRGIMKRGTDARTLRLAIDEAHRDSATVIWCHDRFGLEDIPNWISNRIDAQNIFDGAIAGSYKHSFYRYLNIGFHVPFSTGTDWFIYDFSRAYVKLQVTLSVENWLEGMRAGRSFITNGPFLEFKVNDYQSGQTVKLEQPGQVEIFARGVGRLNFEKLELIQNGKIVHSITSRPENNHFVAETNTTLDIQSPGWLALRTPPPPFEDDPELKSPVPLNELGKPLFAHTSPIYIEIGGKSIFDSSAAKGLIDELETCIKVIKNIALFKHDQEKNQVLNIYREAITILSQKIKDTSL